MTFIYACLAWIVIAAILAAGIFLMVTKGSPWLFAVATLGLIVAVGKIGCATH
jgi:hypothetical protein